MRVRQRAASPRADVGLPRAQDTWTTLLELLGLTNTQPHRVEPTNHLHPHYAHVAPLLGALATEFSAAHAALLALAPAVRDAALGLAPAALGLFSDLLDSADMLARRSAFVRQLYSAAAPLLTRAERRARLAQARLTIEGAAGLVARREAAYRVPAGRVASWRLVGPPSSAPQSSAPSSSAPQSSQLSPGLLARVVRAQSYSTRC